MQTNVVSPSAAQNFGEYVKIASIATSALRCWMRGARELSDGFPIDQVIVDPLALIYEGIQLQLHMHMFGFISRPNLKEQVLR